MRVLLASAHGADLSYAGAERYVHDLAAGLEQHGHQVSLLSAFPVRDESAARTAVLHASDWRQDRIRRLANHAGDWLSLPSPALARRLTELAPDLLHTSNLPGLSTAIWEAARRLRIPVVHTLHDYHLLCPRTTLLTRDGRPCDPGPLLCGLRTRSLRRWAGAVAVAIGVSAYVLERHAAFFPLDTQRRVIHAPAPPPIGAGTPPRRPPQTLGFVGRLVAAKGVELLLEAAPELAALGLRLRLAGGGELAQAVAADPHVDYAGQLADTELAAFMESCDLGLVPSLWEEPGLTYVLLEWRAAGRPVLATCRGGLAEAAPLGGVTTFDGTPAGLVGAARELLAPGRFETLVTGLPQRTGDDQDRGRERERWLELHLSAYDAAFGAGRR